MIRILWWPSKTETLSMGTPARSSSTANVSRNRCACPSGIFARLKSLCSRVCQLRTMLSSFPPPLQKKNLFLTLGVFASVDTTSEFDSDSLNIRPRLLLSRLAFASLRLGYSNWQAHSACEGLDCSRKTSSGSEPQPQRSVGIFFEFPLVR